MLLGILKESAPGETRVALLPESLKSLLAHGIAITVEAGAGVSAGRTDQAYSDAGATVSRRTATILLEADLLPTVNVPHTADQTQLKPGAVVIGFMRPLDAPHALLRAIETAGDAVQHGVDSAHSRAQSMDALSSMATVPGTRR